MREKILVVDDEPLILSTIHRALGKKGYEMRIANNADEFMSELAREHADLLIMDVNLGGLNSQTLLDQIFEVSPESKILFISGLVPDIPHCHFLEKPFRLDDLRRRVRNILDGLPPSACADEDTE
jgi:DNA-binding response OmpR family regulator